MAIPNLIGITGLEGVGKDTLAAYLSKCYGYTVYSLASPIKELLNARFGWTMADWDNRQWKEAAAPQCGFAWQGSPHHFSPRSWAQWLGTDVAREIGGEDIWVKRMVTKWYGHPRPLRMVVPDVRFDNEADTIRGMGGAVLKITRPSQAVKISHVSQIGVQPKFIDATIVNDEGIDDFLSEAISVLQSLKGEV